MTPAEALKLPPGPELDKCVCELCGVPTNAAAGNPHIMALYPWVSKSFDWFVQYILPKLNAEGWEFDGMSNNSGSAEEGEWCADLYHPDSDTTCRTIREACGDTPAHAACRATIRAMNKEA